MAGKHIQSKIRVNALAGLTAGGLLSCLNGLITLHCRGQNDMEKPAQHSKQGLAALSLAALGVVFGDIGTSPLYAFRLCFNSETPPTEASVLGILSLIFWSLAGLITVKYLTLVLRADNRGEGGILALMALVRRGDRPATSLGTKVIVGFGLFGAALLYGDGLITPAISVLSAVEGLQVAAPSLHSLVVPLALIVLVGLFWIQKHGTQRVGNVFGPVMMVWFLVIAILGIRHIVQVPAVFAAMNPAYAVGFFAEHRFHAFVTMGTVFLCMTGGEDLYLDMGHFGRRPIRIDWFAIVLPALLLNYFGQGAFLLQHPQETDNLFYRLAPSWSLYPLVALATAATVIASQAVISGAFSLTRQAMQLGYCPRQAIIHTSEATIGQVYLPAVNGMLLVGTVSLVLGFRHSDSLAGAYGLAVSMTMLLTTIMLTIFMRRSWHWHPVLVALVMAPIFALDAAFFTSNILKIPYGGWVGLSVAIAMFTLMVTWHRGRFLMSRKLADESLPLAAFLKEAVRTPPLRVPGTAVFMTGNADIVPRTLLHNYKHNKVLHSTIVLMQVMNEEVPRVPDAERVTIEPLEAGFTRIVARYGFSEDPDLASLLRSLKVEGLVLDPMKCTFFLGRETLVLGAGHNMLPWRKHLFAYLSRNALDASKFFHLPPNRIIEIGMQVEL
jgi:KUP system potassium uptake protein